MTPSLDLPGLEGSNPAGFLAALGVLAAAPSHWTLLWGAAGPTTPTLRGPRDAAELIDRLLADRDAWGGQSLLTLLPVDEMKMPPQEFRRLATALLQRPRNRRRLEADWLAVLGNEWVTDGSGKNIKPTALDFAAGQQKFLKAVREIRTWNSPDRPWTEQFRAALFSPWRKADPVPALGYDAAESRDYALRLLNPSTDTKTTEAGAEWLAFRGLIALPSAPRGDRLLTACVGGTWKQGWLRWPLWNTPAAYPEVAALLTEPRLAALSPAERRRRGLLACYRADILRSDQGGYGSFAPARPAGPEDDPV